MVPRVYRELRRLAGRCLRNERSDNTLQVTDLVHEAYFALSGCFATRLAPSRPLLRCLGEPDASDSRRSRALPHLEQALDISARRSAEIVALDDALETLAAVNPRKARIVELRFFAGLELKETAAVVGVSAETVMRDWKLAKAWLLKELTRL